MTELPATTDITGIKDVPFETYLTMGDTSKSSLWTAIDKSPAHAKVAKEESNAMAMGTAVHVAVLEPEEFHRFVRGPDDRRGNKWKDALDEHGANLLTSGDYDNALAIRDRFRREPLIKKLVGAKTLREISGFARDPATGLMIRIRPDARRDDIALTVDLKATTDVRADPFSRRIAQFGYHLQEAIYRDTWARAAIGTNHNPETDAFIFLTVEMKEPFEFIPYELDEDDVAAGRKTAQAALDLWKRCVETGQWPGYARQITPIARPAWVRRGERDPEADEE